MKKREAISERSIQFNPCSDQFHQNPYPVYERLQQHAPLHRMMGSWVLTRYEDVAAVLRNRRFSSKLFEDTIWRNKPDFGCGEADPIKFFIRKAIVFTENPDHSRLRSLTNDCFSPKAAAQDHKLLKNIIETFIDEVLEQPHVDIVADVAGPVAMVATGARIGLDVGRIPDMTTWVGNVRKLLDPGLMTAEDYQLAHDGLTNLLAVMEQRMTESAANGEKNMFSCLRARERRGDTLSEREISLTAVMSFIAGTETTKALISNAVYLLLNNPGQLDLLRQNPSLMSGLVDEVLRFESPLQQTKRVALEDIEIPCGLIRGKNQVLVCLGASNRDPAKFPDPHRFDIKRENSHDHMAFGHGMRTCLGAPIASKITEITIEKLFLSDIAIKAETKNLRWQTASRILRCIESLPVQTTSPALA